MGELIVLMITPCLYDMHPLILRCHFEFIVANKLLDVNLKHECKRDGVSLISVNMAATFQCDVDKKQEQEMAGYLPGIPDNT